MIKEKLSPTPAPLEVRQFDPLRQRYLDTRIVREETGKELIGKDEEKKKDKK